MKKKLSFAVTAMAILGLGTLTSCHDEDFDVSTAVLQERAFEQGFIKEFGKPSADQSWDFYAQRMESLRQGAGTTRATQAEISVNVENATQPSNAQYFKDIAANMQNVLTDHLDNSHVGQNSYSLVSTGTFNIYAIEYCGDYQKKSDYDFQFGIAYLDEAGKEQKKPLFGYYESSSDKPVNPGYAKKVTVTPGESFYFYITLSLGYYNGYKAYYTYYSNSPTYTLTYTDYWGRLHTVGTYTYANHTGSNGITYKYNGSSTLAYSTQLNDENKQVMILGFEDGWRPGPADWDFNDVIILIEGDLPEPTSKRFFCEDLESFDWDYNDVVFDVSNYGITLRALGGTLPVFLRVKDRTKGPNDRAEVVSLKKNGKVICELHELMRALQPQEIHQNEELIYYRDVKNKETGVIERKPFYKPIDADSYVATGIEGLWFDAVQILNWTTSMVAGQPNTRLEEGEVELFANPLAGDAKVGDVELVVLPEYSSSGYDVNTIANLSKFDDAGDDKNDARPKITKIGDAGSVPAIWTAPVSVNWMQEMKKITLGYPRFYGGGTTPTGGTQPEWWGDDPSNPNNPGNCYSFKGDKPE